MAPDVYDTPATHHVGLRGDVINTDCWVPSGNTHGRVFTTFKGRYFTSKTRTEKKKEKRVFFVVVLFVF